MTTSITTTIGVPPTTPRAPGFFNAGDLLLCVEGKFKGRLALRVFPDTCVLMPDNQPGVPQAFKTIDNKYDDKFPEDSLFILAPQGSKVVIQNM